MIKKILLLISVIALMSIYPLSASSQYYEFRTLDGKDYVEDENTKIIDHVVYRLCTSSVDKHYDVYDWFDSKETFETLEEINIVSEIDGIKVKGIMCRLFYDDETGFNHNYVGYYHNYSVKKVTIPDTIEKIGEGAFSIFDGLEELVVPASVNFNESHCFDYMENLKNLTFLGDIYYLPDDISDKLENVTINGSVILISGGAFENCTSLKSFKLFGNLGGEFLGTTGGFGGSVFKNCTSLEEVVLPKETDNFKIYNSDFEGCTSLKSITLPETCGELTIGENAFRGCTSLETVTLPANCDSITIGYRAFRDCKNLTTVNNTDNITKIYGGAFRDCTSLKRFTVSDKTTMIGKNAFYGCKNLKTVTVNSKTKAPKLYANAFAKTNSALTFTAKNATAAKSWKSALTKSGLKNAKVGYMHYV